MTDFSFEINAEEASREGGIVIGQDPEICDLPLPDAQVSARHLRVSVKGSIVHLEDLNTQSGTFINDVRLAPFAPMALKKNALIRFGTLDVTLDFLPASPSSGSASAFNYADAPLRARAKSRKGLFAIVILVGVLVAGGLVVAGYGYEYYKAYKIEEAFWEKAVRENSVPGFRIYIKTYPEGRHHEAAIAAIERIQREIMEAAIAADHAAFAAASNENSINAFEGYLKLYPKGLNVLAAEAAIKTLKDELARSKTAEAEKAAWEKANNSKRKNDYQQYLNDYPNGPNAPSAQAALDTINATEAEEQRLAAEKRKREDALRAKREKSLQAMKQFKKAREKNTVAALRSFLSAYPDSNEAPQAMLTIGSFYASGRSVQKNPAEGVRWYKQAAAKGNADAMINLAKHYEDGLGVAKSATVAASWYRKAHAAGSIFAQSFLKQLQKRTGVR
jgi:TPR repeat protein